jgi:hypothetical protein
MQHATHTYAYVHVHSHTHTHKHMRPTAAQYPPKPNIQVCDQTCLLASAEDKKRRALCTHQADPFSWRAEPQPCYQPPSPQLTGTPPSDSGWGLCANLLHKYTVLTHVTHIHDTCLICTHVLLIQYTHHFRTCMHVYTWCVHVREFLLHTYMSRCMHMYHSYVYTYAYTYTII